MDSSYINEISKYLLSNNLVLFIGAGFSREFGYPGWGELLSRIIYKFKIENELTDSTLFLKFEKTEFENNEEINMNIFNGLKGVDFLRLADYIDYLIQKQDDTNGRRSDIKSSIIEEINNFERMRINNERIDVIRDFFNKYKSYLEEIVTTNYDTNIEYCFNNDVSVIHRGYDSLNHIEKRNKIYKIHGCINDPNKEIVITETDYQNFLLKNRYLFYKIFSLLTEKKLVFLGYSINDPNIRSLLNEIKYESNNKVNLEVYWVNYDKVNSLDKEYYNKVHKIKIIEDISIVDFLNSLDSRVKDNQLLKNIDKDNVVEIVDNYKNNFNDKVYIDEMINIRKIINYDNREDILKKLYVNIIDDRDRVSLEPFFYLFLSSNVDIKRRLKLNIQNILEIKSKYIFFIIKYMDSDEEKLFQTYLTESGLVDIFMESAIEYCEGHHAFGEYGHAIVICFKIAELFKEAYKNKRVKILACLANNIRKSSKTKWLGYDWNALSEVEKYIHILSEDDVKKLIDLVSRGDNCAKEEQLDTILDSYNFSEAERKKIKYNYLIKSKISRKISDKIEVILRKLSEPNIIEWFKVYQYNYQENLITLSINEDDEYVEFKILSESELIILQEFDMENKECRIIVQADGDEHVFMIDSIDNIDKLIEKWVQSTCEIVFC